VSACARLGDLFARSRRDPIEASGHALAPRVRVDATVKERVLVKMLGCRIGDPVGLSCRRADDVSFGVIGDVIPPDGAT